MIMLEFSQTIISEISCPPTHAIISVSLRLFLSENIQKAKALMTAPPVIAIGSHSSACKRIILRTIRQ